MKIDLRNRQKILTVAAALVVGLLIGDKVILTPLTNSWKARKDRIEYLDKTLSSGRALMERDQSLRSRWTDMKHNALPMNPSDAEQAVLNAVYNRWAPLSRANVSDYAAQWKASGDDDYLTYECSVNAVGSMEALTRFLYQLEKDPLAIRIENLDLTGSKDASGRELALTVRFTGLMLTSTQK